MKIKEGSLSYWILLSLQKATENIYLEDFTYSGQMRALKGLPSKVRTNSFAESMRRLRTKGLLEQEKMRDGRMMLRLTIEGNEALINKESLELGEKYTVVVWDIPETKRTVRNLLRRRLKEWGFRSWQKSVWVSRSDVASKLRTFISEVGIEKWVGVIESEDPVLGSLFVKQ